MKLHALILIPPEYEHGCWQDGLTQPFRLPEEDLLLIAECSLPGEWEGRVIYLPLR